MLYTFAFKWPIGPYALIEYILSWTKNFSVKGMRDVTSYTDYIERLVHSNIETKNQRLLSTLAIDSHRGTR